MLSALEIFLGLCAIQIYLILTYLRTSDKNKRLKVTEVVETTLSPLEKVS